MPILSRGQLSLTDMNDAIVSGSEPSSPSNGTLWVDSSVTPNLLKQWNGSLWIVLGEISTQGTGTVIDNINTTLGNMANDNLIDYNERQMIKDRLTEIIGYIIDDSATTLPTIATLDASLKGSVYTYRKRALNAGITSADTAYWATYTAVQTKYDALKAYLEGLTPIDPWDLRIATQLTNIVVVKDTFRQKWLDFYIALEDLAESTSKKLKDNVDNVQIGGKNLISVKGIKPFGSTTVDASQYLNNGRVEADKTSSDSNGGVAFDHALTYDASETYTFRFKLQKLTGYLKNISLYTGINISTISWTINGVPYTKNATVNLTDDSSIYEVVATIKTNSSILANPSSTNGIYIQLNKGLTGSTQVLTYRLTELKLEKGNKATDWSPSPEDMVAKNQVVFEINQSTETIKIQGSKIDITGAVTFSSLDSAMQTNINNANAKSKTFTATPTIPYQIGDIWKNGSTVYICTVTRTTGSYTASDWALVGDVTSLNTSADTSKVAGTASATVLANANNGNTAYSTVNSWKATGKTTIDGGMIETNTIFANKMAIADFTNFCAIDENNNPNGYTVATVNSLKYFKVGQVTYASIALNSASQMPFKVGDYYYLGFYGYRDSVITGVNFIIRYFYTDGTWSNAGTVGVSGLDTSDALCNAKLKIASAPTVGKVISRVDFFLENNNDATGYYYLRNIELRKMYGGELIVDGSITASMIKSLNGLNVGNGNFVIDSSGNVTFKGTLNGASGTFTGAVTTTSPQSSAVAQIASGYLYTRSFDGKKYANLAEGTLSLQNTTRGSTTEIGTDISFNSSSNNAGGGTLSYIAPLEPLYSGGHGGIGIFSSVGRGSITLRDMDFNVGANMYMNGDINGQSIYMTNWFRSKGNTGWYHQDYGGGWYMTDTTYIRNYNEKALMLLKNGEGLRMNAVSASSTTYVGFYNNAGTRVGWVGKGGVGDAISMSSDTGPLALYSQNNVYYLSGAIINNAGSTTRWQATDINYIAQNQSTGQINFYMNGSVSHYFNSDGSKKAGSIKIGNRIYGMSPVDSPQTIIEYIEFNIPLTNNGTKVYLDKIFIQAVEHFDIWANNGRVVERGEDYFVISGNGTASCKIAGERVGHSGYFWGDMDLATKDLEETMHEQEVEVPEAPPEMEEAVEEKERIA